MTVYYTNAPEAYDYDCTKTRRIVGQDEKGQDVRLVEIASTPDVQKSQVDRYFSGLYWAAADRDEAERYSHTQL